MSDINWLELRISNDKAINQLQKMVHTETTTNLTSPFVTFENTREYLKIQRIRSYISAIREQNVALGIRKEKIHPRWLQNLNDKEKQVFTEVFENKRKFSETASLLEIPEDKVKLYFDRSIKKVIKAMKGEE